MKSRWLVKTAVAVVAVAGLGWTAAPVAQAAALPPVGGTSTSNPAGTVKALFSTAGFQALVDSVAAQVHARYPDAQLMEVDGRSPSGKTMSITDVTQWRFDYNATQDGKLIVVFATVNLPSWTASLSVQGGVWVGSDPLTDPVAMSPFKASLLLRIAGYHQPYQFVTYRQPNAGAPTPHPLFIFDQANAYVGVDTVTGKVAPLS